MFYPAYGWTTYIFVETPDLWILAQAVGIEREASQIGSARQNSVGMLLAAEHRGLERTQP